MRTAYFFRFHMAAALLCCSAQLWAQQENIPARIYPPAIEDNSFFIEEAYNQENRVVQHISNAVYSRRP